MALHGVVEMTDDVALVAGFTPEWALVLEYPGITADPEPYYTGRYLDGVEVMLIRPQASGRGHQASDLRLQGRGIQATGSSDYRPPAVPAVLRAPVTPCEVCFVLFLQTPVYRLPTSPALRLRAVSPGRLRDIPGSAPRLHFSRVASR